MQNKQKAQHIQELGNASVLTLGTYAWGSEGLRPSAIYK
jgi:hypothetical protein